MSDKSFRVLLDLTDLKIDSLKYVWINVSPQELLTIADFKSYILRKINLENTNIKLYVCKGLLLDSETTTILREDDTVKVHYATQIISEENTSEKFVKENRKSSRKRIHAECINESSINANEFSKDGELFENRNNQDEINIKHKKKKSKRLHSIEPENCSTQSIALETNNLQKLETYKKKDKKLKTSEKNRTDLQICEFFSFNNSECTVLRNKDKSSQNTRLEVSDFSKTNLSKNISSVDNVSLEVENELKDQSSLKTASAEDFNALNNTSSKRKRKRRKKRKNTNETTSHITDNTNSQSEFKSFVFEVNKSFQGKHVVYSSSPSKEEVIDIDCDNSFKDIESPNAETFVLNGSLSNCTVESSYNHPKISTPAQSNNLENPNWCLSGMQNTTTNSPVKIFKKDLGLSTTNSIPNKSWNFSNKKSFSRQSEEFKTKEKAYSELPSLNARSDVGTHIAYKKDLELPANSIPNNSWNSSNAKSFSRQSEEFKTKEKPSEKSYSELPPLNSTPDVGTHIAYKVLELDEHYSPVISDYREGIVRSINFENEEMEIELLKHVIKPGRTGKFENLREGEIPLPEVKKYDAVKWSSLVEPKLLSC